MGISPASAHCHFSLLDVCVQPHLHVSVRVEGQRSSVSSSVTFHLNFWDKVSH